MSGFGFEGGDFDYGGTDLDTAIRITAFEEIRRLTAVDQVLDSQQVLAGFRFRSQRIPFVNPQRGIFKPRRMAHLLSLKTVVPRRPELGRYEDQRRVHGQIYAGDETVSYSFMGNDPDAADNRWLRDAMLHQVPLIYFLGVAPGRYQPIIPTFIVGFDARRLEAQIAFSQSETATAPPTSRDDRRYAVRAVKQRLHQATFRDLVIAAYGGRCAISGLSEPRLLDAAHIMDDKDERLGQPIVTNGIPLSKIHHAAFDANLIGIDPDRVVRVSPRLLEMRDGPTLEALRNFDGHRIRSPRYERDNPDRHRLAARYEMFKAAV